MPTYDYKCEACGHRFEAFQSIKDDPIEKCPSCGNYSVQRLISPGGGLIFKGSGYYITDYRNKNSSYSQAAKNDTPSSTSDSKSTTSSDSKSTDSTTKKSSD